MENAAREYETKLQNYEKRLREWNLSQLRRVFTAEIGGFSDEELQRLERQSESNALTDALRKIKDAHPAGQLYAAYLIAPFDPERARAELIELKENSTQIAVLFDDFPQNMTIGAAAEALRQNLPIGFHPSLGKPLSPEEERRREAEYQAGLAKRSPLAKLFDSVLQKLGF